MTKKAKFDSSTIDWNKVIDSLIQISQPIFIFGAWLAFSKFDKRADAVSKIIAIAEPIPAIDLNLPKPVVLASLYHSMEDALKMLEALAQALEDLPGVVSDKLQDIINQVKEEVEEITEPLEEVTKLPWWVQNFYDLFGAGVEPGSK